MHRRRFLKSAASAAVAAAGLASRSAFGQGRTVDRVGVVGAGIVGASIAYHLAKRGCEVVIFEKRQPAAQASGNTFAWINAAYANRPPAYQALRRLSLDEYRRLAGEMDFPIRWSGSLEWFQDRAKEATLVEEVEAFRAATGEPTSIIDADRALEIEPNLHVGGDWKLAYSTNDGAVDATATTLALFDRAVALGAESVMPAEVRSIVERDGRIEIATDADTFAFDLAVVAAGVGTAAIARTLGEDVDTATRTSPGIIVTTEPVEPIVNTVLYPPRVHVHQHDDGRVVLGEKAGAPATTVHEFALAGRPNRFPDPGMARRHVERILALARAYLPALEAVGDAEAGIGWRPMPADGLPIIGHGNRAQNVYFATMHSGVTLAPIVGRFAAAEILDGARLEMLDAFRPRRFQRPG